MRLNKSSERFRSYEVAHPPTSYSIVLLKAARFVGFPYGVMNGYVRVKRYRTVRFQ